MKHGFIKVAAATPYVTVADTKSNAAEIIRLSREASCAGVKLVVFPELSITGATCGDLFLQKPLLDGAVMALSEIAAETSELETIICVGAPIRRDNKLYNCAVVIYQGMILGVSPKKELSPRGELAETRIFTPAPEKCGTVEIDGIPYPFGANILYYCEGCHDFNFACVLGGDIMQPEPLSTNHARAGAAVICGLSAMPELVGRAEHRRLMAASHTSRISCGYILSEAGDGESTTDYVFGGHRLIYEGGRMLSEAKPFSECGQLSITELDVSKLSDMRMKRYDFKNIEVTAENYYSISFDMEISDTALTRTIEQKPFVPSDAAKRAERCEAILMAQSHGLKKRIEHTHAKTAVIGISGGLDSCLALLVSVCAMDLLKRPRTDIIAVTMPCFGTTVRTRTNAEVLCERLGVSFRCIDIKAAVTQHFRDIGHDEREYNVVYENVQARERTQVIMDIANAEGGMVVGTGDLSELALGWATYNGDHMSMYGVNSSVPKTLIRHIVAHFADICNDAALHDVLYDILDTPVSPELLPADKNGEIAQRTEDLVGPYELHDFFMYYFLRHSFAPEKLERLANYAFADVYDKDTVHKWLATFLRRFMSQQFKRSCLPDGPKVGSVGISPRGDLNMPSDAVSALWIEW